MRSPAFVPVEVLAMVNVGVWVELMSISPGEAGDVCVTVKDLAASAGVLATASKARKPQRIIAVLIALGGAIFAPERLPGEEFSCILSAAGPGPRSAGRSRRRQPRSPAPRS